MKKIFRNLGSFKTFSALSIFLASWSFAGPTRIITDNDLTVKPTNLYNMAEAAKDFLYKNDAFSGMAELYTAFLEEQKAQGLQSNPLAVVTVGVEAMEMRTEDYLYAIGLGYAQIYSRPTFHHVGKLEHKVNTILELLRNSKEPAILVGDDFEFDPEAYLQVQAQLPEKVAAIYIRRVRGREMPPEVVSYDTAMDIAANEFLAGRLSEAGALRVAKSILSESNLANLRPYFFKIEPAAFTALDQRLAQRSSILAQKRTEVAKLFKKAQSK